jgi:hypothetical protein
MPYIEFTPKTEDVFDLYEDGNNKTISYKKMSNYIDLVIEIKERGTNIDRLIFMPFKGCETTDFTSRNYELSESFTSNMKWFFCPDISPDFEKYKVEGKYTN